MPVISRAYSKSVLNLQTLFPALVLLAGTGIMKKASFAVVAMLSMWSNIAVAGDGYAYECKHYNDVRKIDVVYLKRESLVPCEVNYTKNGVQENLWNATYSEGYCEARAKEFLADQRGWGWECTLIEGEEPAVISTDDKYPSK